ncbi:MAG: SIR2 family protein [Actinobacteria bacterium]|nr:SIR2 family protein [Actinomycetota bacterium]
MEDHSEDVVTETEETDSPPSVRVAGSSSWQAIEASEGDPEEARKSAQDANTNLGERLLSCLAAERLVVLAGLGTSLEIKDAVAMAALWEQAEALDGFDAAANLSPEASEKEDIELLLSRCQSALDLRNDATLRKFVKAAEDRILELCSFVTGDSDLATHGRFLRRMARRSTRLPRAEIYTTNYDLAFERAAADTRFFLIDGFQMRAPHHFDGSALDIDLVRRVSGEGMVLEPNVAQFLKLHGSVDWQRDGSVVRRVLDKPKNPALIYPRQNKFQLSFAPPYLEFMARFQMALRGRDTALFIIGSGLKDEHVIQPIHQAVKSNVGLRVVLVSPDLEGSDNRYLSAWSDLISQGDRRLALINGTFKQFTEILPDTAPLDERELHDQRIEESAMFGS